MSWGHRRRHRSEPARFTGNDLTWALDAAFRWLCGRVLDPVILPIISMMEQDNESKYRDVVSRLAAINPNVKLSPSVNESTLKMNFYLQSIEGLKEFDPALSSMYMRNNAYRARASYGTDLDENYTHNHIVTGTGAPLNEYLELPYDTVYMVVLPAEPAPVYISPKLTIPTEAVADLTETNRHWHTLGLEWPVWAKQFEAMTAIDGWSVASYFSPMVAAFCTERRIDIKQYFRRPRFQYQRPMSPDLTAALQHGLNVWRSMNTRNN